MIWYLGAWAIGAVIMRVMYFWVNRKARFRLLDEVGFGLLAILWPFSVTEAIMLAIRNFLLDWD